MSDLIIDVIGHTSIIPILKKKSLRGKLAPKDLVDSLLPLNYIIMSRLLLLLKIRLTQLVLKKKKFVSSRAVNELDFRRHCEQK